MKSGRKIKIIRRIRAIEERAWVYYAGGGVVFFVNPLLQTIYLKPLFLQQNRL